MLAGEGCEHCSENRTPDLQPGGCDDGTAQGKWTYRNCSQKLHDTHRCATMVELAWLAEAGYPFRSSDLTYDEWIALGIARRLVQQQIAAGSGVEA